MRLICGGCPCFERSEYHFQKASRKKIVEGSHDHTKLSGKAPHNFPRGVLCAEQLKLLRPETASDSIVFEMPRRNFSMKKEGTVESTVESTKSENETRRSSILKDSSVPDRKTSKAKTATIAFKVAYSVSETDIDNGSDDLIKVEQLESVEVESEKRKVSPTDSGMYSTTSSKLLGDTSLTNIDPSLTETELETSEHDVTQYDGDVIDVMINVATGDKNKLLEAEE